MSFHENNTSRATTRVVRATARLLLSAIFVAGGVDAVRRPEGDAQQARTVTEPLARALPFFPSNTAMVVRINGLLQAVAGIGLAANAKPRAAALVLAASLIPTTIAGHRFWDETNPRKRFAELLGFLENAGLLGGLLLVVSQRSGNDS